MFIREITKDVRKPINEIDIIGGLKWLGRAALGGPAAAAQLALTPSSTSAWDTTDAPAMLYNKLRADGRDDATANAAALELRDRISRGDHTAIQTYRDATGDTGQLPWDLQDLETSINQRIASGGGRGSGSAELAQRRADAANGVPGAGPAPTDSPNADIEIKVPNPTKDFAPVGGIKNPPTAPKATTAPKTTTAPKQPTAPKQDEVPASVATLPSVVKDPAAAQALAQSSPQTASQWADGISKATGGALGASTIQSLSQGAIKYGLPAAAIVALLYGGKKLIDYMGKKKKESIGEEATAGATSAGNIASVANPRAAYSKPKKTGRYGAPQAPQRKNPDGTAKSALDVTDSLMGNGKVVKR